MAGTPLSGIGIVRRLSWSSDLRLVGVIRVPTSSLEVTHAGAISRGSRLVRVGDWGR